MVVGNELKLVKIGYLLLIITHCYYCHNTRILHLA